MVAQLSAELVRAGAIRAGVCVRPLVRRLVDTETGESRLVPIPCGSTRETVCPSCADKARRLRMQQCREGWHLEDDPLPPEPEPCKTNTPDVDDTGGGAGDGNEDQASRRVRSTRRRQDVPDLPRLPVANRSIGKAFHARDGKVWRPSMFVTFTLPSYGRVHADGTPVDPGSYDYRRAALDAIHLAALWDRLTQNLRRAVGYRVQYFAAVEPQRRLAPHLHAAIRGAIPRKLLKQVIAATYHQVWWPAHEHPVYVEALPAWDENSQAYVDPHTGVPLPTWEQALDALDDDPDAGPAHVIRFGQQTDVQGLIAGSPDADRRVGYLTKYLTKNITDPLDDADELSPAREAHIDRLHAELVWLPCSPECANWLRYGIQPKNRVPGLAPGCCDGKTHDREHLGVGGRRVLVSRYWTGKTLSEHRADRIGAVRAVLEAAGATMHDTGRYAATADGGDGRSRFLWEPVALDDLPTYTRVIAQTIAERNRWRHEYEAAKRAGPSGGPVDNSLGKSTEQPAA